MSTSRYWRIGFTSEPTHWVHVDCGGAVTEKEAVALAEKAITGRGTVFAAVQEGKRNPPGGVIPAP